MVSLDGAGVSDPYYGQKDRADDRDEEALQLLTAAAPTRLNRSRPLSLFEGQGGLSPRR
jgi:hypothetical protein